MEANDDQINEESLKECYRLLDVSLKTDALKIPIDIFEDYLKSTYLPKQEVHRFCKMEELDIAIIYAYMRYGYINISLLFFNHFLLIYLFIYLV